MKKPRNKNVYLLSCMSAVERGPQEIDVQHFAALVTTTSKRAARARGLNECKKKFPNYDSHHCTATLMSIEAIQSLTHIYEGRRNKVSA